MKLPAKEIIRDYPVEDLPHRRDFETCPSCDTKYKNEKWNEHATILVLRIVFGKHEDCAVVSECSKCFEKSWVHNHLYCVYDTIFGEEWEIAAYKELDARREAAKIKWDRSLCRTCKKLEKPAKEKDTNAWITCPVLIGGATSKCEHYKKGKENKRTPSGW